MSGRASTWTSSVLNAVSAAHRYARRPRVSRMLFIIGATCFLGLAYLSFKSVPSVTSWDWQPSIALLAIGIPLAMYLNTAEYRCIAATVDIHLDWRTSFVTATAAALANLLPIPGAAAVRTTAMVRRGGSALRSGEANMLAAINWVSIAGLLAAGTLGTGLHGRWALPAIIGGSAFAFGLSSIRLASISSWRSVIELSLVETGKVAVSGIRLYWAFKIIDSPVGIADSLAIGASHALASIAGFFPAGLGLREALAGGIAAAVDIPADTAIAATIVDRFAGQIGILAVMLVGAVVPGSPARDVFRKKDEPRLEPPTASENDSTWHTDEIEEEVI